MQQGRRTKMHAQAHLVQAGPRRADAAMTLCGRRTPRGRATKDAGAVTCPACGQVLQRE